MSWTDERVEILKKMWGEGQSASQIAKELGGVTRNAVIGKVHRLVYPIAQHQIHLPSQRQSRRQHPRRKPRPQHQKRRPPQGRRTRRGKAIKRDTIASSNHSSGSAIAATAIGE